MQCYTELIALPIWLNKIENINKPANINAAQIPFKSEKFKAANVHSALEESKGLVLGQLNPLNVAYTHEMTIREVLDRVFHQNDYNFNTNMLELLSVDVNQVTNKDEAINELLKLIVRLDAQIQELTNG